MSLSSSSYPMIEMNRAIEIVLNRTKLLMMMRNDASTRTVEKTRSVRGGIVETISVEKDYNKILGRIVAQDVVSEISLPLFDASIMDG